MKPLLLVVSIFLFSVFTIHIAEADVRGDQSRYLQHMDELKLVPAGMNQNQLKVYLMDRYFDVYVVYRELTMAQQAQVHNFYSNSSSPTIDELDALVRELI